MKLVLLKVSAMMLLVALLYTAAWGQNRIEMKIVDETKTAVENPVVKAENENDHLVYEASEDNGVLVFSLPNGDYTITTSDQHNLR